MKEIKDEVNVVEDRVTKLEEDVDRLLQDNSDNDNTPEQENLANELHDLTKLLKTRISGLEDQTKVVVVNLKGDE